MSILSVDTIQPIGSGSTVTLNAAKIVVGTGITFESNGQAIYAGIITATSFSGSGANLTSLPAANLTGTLPAISGANLTSLPAQATIANNSDNRVITGGSGVNLNGESTLTYSSPQLKLLSGDAAPQIRINSDTSDGSSTRLTIGRATGSNHFVNGASSGDSAITFGTNLLFGVGTSEKLRIASNGNVGINQTSPSDKLHVSGTTNFTGNSYIGGDLYMYGSSYTKGIFLGGSGSANKLDDYEEGQFTATVAQGGTVSSFSHNKCSYTKIGRFIHFQMYLMINGSGNGSLLQIGGLPFTAVGYANGYGGAYIAYQNNVFQRSGDLALYVPQNSNNISFYTNAGASFAGNAGAVFANKDFVIVGSYITST